MLAGKKGVNCVAERLRRHFRNYANLEGIATGRGFL